MAQAYIRWQPEKVTEWWASVRNSSECPTTQQEAFLQCVVDRCSRERRELQAFLAEEYRKGGKGSKDKKTHAKNEKDRSKKKDSPTQDQEKVMGRPITNCCGAATIKAGVNWCKLK